MTETKSSVLHPRRKEMEVGMTEVEILQAGRTTLLECEWGKASGGAMPPPHPQKCAITALPSQNDIWGSEAYEAASNRLTRTSRVMTDLPIHEFNDLPETSLNDVLAVYDEAILQAKEDEARV